VTSTEVGFKSLFRGCPNICTYRYAFGTKNICWKNLKPPADVTESERSF